MDGHAQAQSPVVVRQFAHIERGAGRRAGQGFLKAQAGALGPRLRDHAAAERRGLVLHRRGRGEHLEAGPRSHPGQAAAAHQDRVRGLGLGRIAARGVGSGAEETGGERAFGLHVLVLEIDLELLGRAHLLQLAPCLLHEVEVGGALLLGEGAGEGQGEQAVVLAVADGFVGLFLVGRGRDVHRVGGRRIGHGRQGRRRLGGRRRRTDGRGRAGGQAPAQVAGRRARMTGIEHRHHIDAPGQGLVDARLQLLVEDIGMAADRRALGVGRHKGGVVPAHLHLSGVQVLGAVAGVVEQHRVPRTRGGDLAFEAVQDRVAGGAGVEQGDRGGDAGRAGRAGRVRVQLQAIGGGQGPLDQVHVGHGALQIMEIRVGGRIVLVAEAVAVDADEQGAHLRRCGRAQGPCRDHAQRGARSTRPRQDAIPCPIEGL